MNNNTKIARWFLNRLHTIMAHNDYTNDMLTTATCTPNGKWTPTDLILREYYNNGGGSAKGFLGISKAECIKCYKYAHDNQELLKSADYYNECGWNNYGFELWNNYKIH